MQPQEGTPAPVPEPTPAPQPTPQPSTPASPSSKTNIMAIFGLVLAFFIPILGLILSIVAKSQIKKTGEGGKGLATAGIIISAVNLVIVAGLLILITMLSVTNLQEEKRSQSSTNTSTNSSTTNTSSYSADEKKAVVNSEAFLKAIQAGDYSAAYTLLGPELKKEYPGGQAEFQKEVEKANLKLIKSWKIETATTNGSGDRITVKGTATFSGANPTGVIEFGYYIDADGSVRMYLWEIRPN